MAISKCFLASLILCFIFLQIIEQTEARFHVTSDQTVDSKIDCGAACLERCRLSSRPNLCKRACGTCCARCSCVPPGTSGNQQSCPCYYNMTTHGGRRKCP